MMFRKMLLTDIDAGLSLCRSAQWNQLSRDWEIFLTQGPDGSRVCIDDSGNVVGTVTTIRYGDHFSWIGMVLVDPSQRRKGIGSQLMEHALQILSNERCIKLDATPAGQQVYLKLGFENEYTLSRMVAGSVSTHALATGLTATPLTQDDLDAVVVFDQNAFGADRASMLRWMLEGAPELAFKIYSGGQLMGYCFGRPGYRYKQIGPVVAVDESTARELVSAALKQCGTQAVVLDVPHHNTSWLSWIGALGFSELRPFIRMYKGDNAWPGHPENQFAMLGPEFG